MDIRFIFSPQYENVLNPDGKNSREALAYPRISALKKFWSTTGEDIEFAFMKATQLSFEPDAIKCYLNSKASLSDPLSLRIENITDMRDNLIHELAHVILTQNNIGKTKGWKKLQEDFKDESPITRTHILVHAIHLIITKQLFPRRKKAIENYSIHPAYKRSWEIVNEEGEWNLLDRYLLSK